MATTTGYVPATNIINGAASRAGDPTARIVRRPVYLSFVQKGLERMSFDTQFERRFLDTTIPESGVVSLPKWMTGMAGVWLYNGDRCNPLGMVPIYEKEGYASGFSNSPWNSHDDIMQMGASGSNIAGFGEPDRLRYYGIVGDKMHLSRQCKGYEFIRIEYSGIGIDDYCAEEDILIPLWAREAITDFVAMKALEVRQFQEGKQQIFRAVMQDLYQEVNGPNGSWARAQIYWGGLDAKERFDTHLYVGRLGRSGETM